MHTLKFKGAKKGSTGRGASKYVFQFAKDTDESTEGATDIPYVPIECHHIIQQQDAVGAKLSNKWYSSITTDFCENTLKNFASNFKGKEFKAVVVHQRDSFKGNEFWRVMVKSVHKVDEANDEIASREFGNNYFELVT